MCAGDMRVHFKATQRKHKFFCCIGKCVLAVFAVEALEIHTKDGNYDGTFGIFRYRGHFILEVFVVQVFDCIGGFCRRCGRRDLQAGLFSSVKIGVALFFQCKQVKSSHEQV